MSRHELPSTGTQQELSADDSVATPERKGRQWREAFTTGRFYTNLMERIITLGRPELSVGDFNIFCCRAVFGSGEQNGYVSIRDLVTYFKYTSKTVLEMVHRDELVSIRIGNQHRIPGIGIILISNVSLWHSREVDKPTRLQALQEGDLSVLDRYESVFSIPRMWESFAASKFNGTIPPGCNWNELIRKPTPTNPQAK